MSRLERWLYRDLIDVYYDKEKPLPLSLDDVCFDVGADSEEERTAVAKLLRFKFVKTEHGYVHERCEAEIAAYRLKAETAQSNGKKGGRPRKADGNPNEPNPEPNGNLKKPSGFPAGSNSVATGNPEQTGSQTNQEPRTNNQYVNRSGSGDSTASACASARDSPPAAAAFVEMLEQAGIDAKADDPLIARWGDAGVSREHVLAAIAEARQRRAKRNSAQAVNVGFVDAILADALAARGAISSVAVAPSAEWHRTWSGIVGRGRELGAEQQEGEPDAEFKLRVFNAAGDGPWWAAHFPAMRRNGPVPIAALVGKTGNDGGRTA